MPRAQDRIRAAAADVSPSLARVGHWMSAHLISTLSRSADEIAQLTGTSVAAVNRFARAAGFEGFTALKSALGDELQAMVAPIHKLGKAAGRGSGGGGRRALAAAIADPEALQRAVSTPDIARAAGMLIKARRVLILGLGTSAYLAGFAAQALMLYVPNVTAIAGEGGAESAARRLARCGAGDVLVAITLPRYSKETIRLAEYARDRGVRVIAITNSRQAPIARAAELVLVAPSEHPVLTSSILGAAAVIESLAAHVIGLHPDAARIAREHSEFVLTYLTTGTPPARGTARKESRP